MLEAHLLKIFGSPYLIDIIIYHSSIKPLSVKLRNSKGRTYPLPLDIAYIKTCD
jgi:hypothetical protein